VQRAAESIGSIEALLNILQGYLAHEKPNPPRTTAELSVSAYMYCRALGQRQFLMIEISLYVSRARLLCPLDCIAGLGTAAEAEGASRDPYTCIDVERLFGTKAHPFQWSKYRDTSLKGKDHDKGLGIWLLYSCMVLEGGVFSLERYPCTLAAHDCCVSWTATPGWALMREPTKLQGYLAHKKSPPLRTIIGT